ncbi:MAG: MFS transporter [Rhodospirillaceae bacterium]|nr:MFS transporter [Rhodospirillaceae bacterium]MBT5457583.1 MFS transporter [Rhodospirillaceae bacterium]
MPTDPPSAPETDTARKGWVVVAALFMTLGIVVTARNSIGLMMPFWSKEFDWTYGFVSTAGATMMTVMALVAPGAGLLIDRFGARVIYGMGMGLIGIALIVCSFMTDKWELLAFYSIMGGIGFAVVSPSIVSSTVAQYFHSGLGLATSVATSGSTGGQLALMPLLGILVVTVGWRPSFIGIGVIILIAALIVPWVIGERPRSERARGSDDGWGLRATLSQLGHDRTFWLLTAGFFICGFTTAGVVKIHLIPYAVSCGFAPVESAFAYGVMSFFSMVGMITYGYLSDRLHRPYLLASIYFLRALTFILLMQITGSSTTLFLFAILFGIFDYSTFPIVASLVASHIGRRIMGVTMGLIFSSHSLGGAAGTYMGGYLFDLFARYDWVWIVSIGMAGAAAIITLFIVENRTPAPDSELAVA